MVELVWIPLVLQAVVPTRTSRTCTSTRKGPAPEARPLSGDPIPIRLDGRYLVRNDRMSHDVTPENP